MHWLPLLLLFSAGLLCARAAAESFVPDPRLKTDDYTVLAADDARLSSGLKRGQTGSHGKFAVADWERAEQSLSWEVEVPEEDAYAVNVLVCRRNGQPLELAIACAGKQITGTLPPNVRVWTRQPLDGTLRLPKGKQTVVLRARSLNQTPEFSAAVLSVELVQPALRERLHEAALKLRADTRWLQEARYGLMSHWTSQSFPRRGPQKPYAQAVQAFDVETLANQLQESGAGFFVLTTSHAQMFFPAPIKALDNILPGRTAQRDLVAELAAALGKRGIKLMLYYHIGAVSDPEWLKASGFWETDTRRIFSNWKAIVSEVGERYGTELAGWWFDDGSINYYYRSAPWEQLTQAAKAGNPQRLVAYNPWELPSATDSQDYFCGEGYSDPSVGGLLAAGGDGHFKESSHKGLQACATLMTEGDWLHGRKDSVQQFAKLLYNHADIGPPHWNADQLAGLQRAVHGAEERADPQPGNPSGRDPVAEQRPHTQGGARQGGGPADAEMILPEHSPFAFYFSPPRISNGLAMKKLGIVSDTHDRLDRIAAALGLLQSRGAEGLLHLGDFVAPFAMKAVLKFNGPLFAIFGNNDGEKKGLRRIFPGLQDGPHVFEIGGRRLGCAHSVEEIPADYRTTCDGIFYGHSHARLLIPKDAARPLELNPGEACGYLTGQPSCAVLDLATMQAEILESV